MEIDTDFAEDRDAYTADGVFGLSETAGWGYIAKRAKLNELVKNLKVP